MKKLSTSLYSAMLLMMAFVSTFVFGDAKSNPETSMLTNVIIAEQSAAAEPRAFLQLGTPHLDIADVTIFDTARSLFGIEPVEDPAVLESYSRVIANLKRIEPLPPQMLPQVDSETLWLARCIYSETKRPEEQELVAWVIRNRVETGYRGQRSYRDVVLDPYQFSAFNPGTRTRSKYSALSPTTTNAGWQRALRIAHEVKSMPASLRPFSGTTRHFYSEQSMVGGRTPAWAHGQRPVRPKRDFTLEARRFRFYENIA